MRKTLFASFLFLSAGVSAQEYLPGSSNDLEVFLGDMKDAPAPVEAVPAVLAVPRLELKERWPRKHYTYDLRVEEEVLGRIVGTGAGYELRDAAGTLLATATDIKVGKDGRVVKITDGAGASLGTLMITVEPLCLGKLLKAGQKTFQVHDVAGKLLAYSGTVDYDQRQFGLTVLGGGAVSFTNIPRLLSRWSIGPSAGVDRRLTLFVLPYNEKIDIE